MAEPKSTPAARWRESGMSDPHGDVYSRERGALSYGHLTDDEIANAVYLEPNLVHLTAAKDRIRWLSRQLEAAKSALDAARQQGYREGRDAGAKLADERAAGSVTSISFGENFDGSRSDILALVNQISASRIATLAEDIRALTPEDKTP